jgi:hypothetical protein
LKKEEAYQKEAVDIKRKTVTMSERNVGVCKDKMCGEHPSGADGDVGRGPGTGRKLDHNPLRGGRSRVAKEGTNKGDTE